MSARLLLMMALAIIFFVLSGAARSETLPPMMPATQSIPHITQDDRIMVKAKRLAANGTCINGDKCRELARELVTGKNLRTLRIFPPYEYDRPYPGDLWVIRAKSQREVFEWCNTTFTTSYTIGCAKRYPNSCIIMLAPDKDIEQAGYTREHVLRHEEGHCNGWAPDHKGARTLTEVEKELDERAARLIGKSR